jgi:hypothetical protein
MMHPKTISRNAEDKMKWLERSFRKGKVSQEFYDRERKRIGEELAQAKFTEMQEMAKKVSGTGVPNPTMTMKGEHIVIKLICPRCKREGENTFGNICFRVLGKDRNGFAYFECPDCMEHLQYDPVTGQIRIRKGLLGFLFRKFS